MAEGLQGTVDWVGYSVGEPPALPPAGGFVGFLDFVGFSVGAGEPLQQPGNEWLMTARRKHRR
jgi:hypothetical protein